MATHSTGQFRGNTGDKAGRGAAQPRDKRGGDSVVGDDVRGPDALELLTSQHQMVSEVFDRLHDSEDEEEIRNSLFQLADLLSVHTTLEERLFYPAVRSMDTAELIAESLHDHDDVKRVMVALLEGEAATDDFSGELEELEGLIEAHVEQEEDDLFPQVRRLMSPEHLQALGDELTALIVEFQQAGPPHQQLIRQVQHQDGGIAS